MSRYNQLLPIIGKTKPKTIVEVGTWNGLRAIMMATEALKHQKNVHYDGFDLFESATDKTDSDELNVKPHMPVADVRKRLNDFAAVNPGFTFKLHKGNTRRTLLRAKLNGIDLAFIDGGHSIETIRSDYEALKSAKAIVFDDFYKEGPDTDKFGCNNLVKDLPEALVLPQFDPVKGGGKVAMVAYPRTIWPGKHNLLIKTKNCVPDEEIKANISYAMCRIENWVAECAPHDRLAVLVSGGPSVGTYFDEIRERQRAGAYVATVKHSHDALIEANIIPWACILLDPRGHVRDFIEQPHPDILYLTASMVHPSTIERLREKKARVLGYHALVGAGEEEAIGRFGKHILLGGGSTSAIRGISVLSALGFRRFHLYGFDSCYWKKPDTKVKTKTGAKKYFEVNVSGRDFWSDAELVAQAQDFDKLMKQQEMFREFEVYGDGMIPHIWSVSRKVRAEFADVVNG